MVDVEYRAVDAKVPATPAAPPIEVECNVSDSSVASQLDVTALPHTVIPLSHQSPLTGDDAIHDAGQSPTANGSGRLVPLRLSKLRLQVLEESIGKGGTENGYVVANLT